MTPEQRDSVKRAAAAYEAVLAGRALDRADAGRHSYAELSYRQELFRETLLKADVEPGQFVVVGGWAYSPRDGEVGVNRIEVVGVIEA